jgi:hypothetical protein
MPALDGSAIGRTAGRVPVCVVFRCDVCGCPPDPETSADLVRQLLDLRHGEYVDAEPGRGTDRARRLGRGLQQSFGR